VVTNPASAAGALGRTRLLQRLDARWQDLLASYAGLSEDALAEPGVTGTWSVKDIIAHVTVWEGEALAHLPVVLAGRRPPRYSVTHGGINAFNAKMTRRNRDLSLPGVLRHRDATHGRLVEFLQRVPESECGGDTRFRRRLRLDTYGHYAVHARAIRSWRERRSQERARATPRG
jgi:DinB superfamily